MDTITHAGTTLQPINVRGYKSSRRTGNIFHDTVTGDVSVTFKKAGLRTGTLQMLFPDEASALAAENLHCDTGVFVFASTDLPLAGMTYVPSGTIDKELDDETQELFYLYVEYQEVQP